MAKAFFKEVYKSYMCEKCGVRPVYTSRADKVRINRLCRSCYIAEVTDHRMKYLKDLSYEDRRKHSQVRKEAAKVWYEAHKDAHKIIALLSYYKNFHKNREKRNAKRRERYRRTGW